MTTFAIPNWWTQDRSATQNSDVIEIHPEGYPKVKATRVAGTQLAIRKNVDGYWELWHIPSSLGFGITTISHNGIHSIARMLALSPINWDEPNTHKLLASVDELWTARANGGQGMLMPIEDD